MAKGWQILIILLSPIVVGQIFLFNLLQAVSTHENGTMVRIVITSLIVTLFLASLWFLIIGIFLARIDNNRQDCKSLMLYASIAYPTLFNIAFLTLLMLNYNLHMGIVALMHLMSMTCTLYAFYSISKLLIKAEGGDSTSFDGCVKYISLLITLPFGILILQPKINALYEKMNPGANQ